ncbi:MAG: tripartite tricarboxylate transporter substrate binding protein [Hyphomicrobiaceae bacterium]
MTQLKQMVLSAMITLVSVGAASAQTWPTKPIKVIIPFGAGSATDIVPRIVFEPVSQALGQTIVVENRAGAGSTTGTAQVAKADPDGYTFLVTSSAYTIVPAMFDKLGYDPEKDLTGVTLIAALPSVMIVPASLPYSTVQEFVSAAKAKPGTFNFASLGAGSGTHLAAERFRLSAGFDAAHVAFKSGAEALTEIVAGRIQYYMCPVGTAMSFIKEGKVKALAVTPQTRVAALPDVPTTLEAGFKDSDTSAWVGMLAPAGTPKEIVERMHAEIAKALKVDNVRSKLTPNGVEPLSGSIAAFNQQIVQEIAINKVIAKQLALKPN